MASTTLQEFISSITTEDPGNVTTTNATSQEFGSSTEEIDVIDVIDFESIDFFQIINKFLKKEMFLAN